MKWPYKLHEAMAMSSSSEDIGGKCSQRLMWVSDGERSPRPTYDYNWTALALDLKYPNGTARDLQRPQEPSTRNRSL